MIYSPYFMLFHLFYPEIIIKIAKIVAKTRENHEDFVLFI